MNMFSRVSSGGPGASRRPQPANDAEHSAHSMIAWSRMSGAHVIAADGVHVGEIRDLSIDKRTGRAAYVLIAHGGFMGFSEKLHALPWLLLHFDPLTECYKVPCTSSEMKRAPAVTSEDLEWLGCGDEVWRARMMAYYNPYLPV